MGYLNPPRAPGADLHHLCTLSELMFFFRGSNLLFGTDGVF